MTAPLTDLERRTPLVQLGAERMRQAFDEVFGPDPLYVACPYCKAEVGAGCQSAGEGVMQHPSRFRLAVRASR